MRQRCSRAFVLGLLAFVAVTVTPGGAEGIVPAFYSAKEIRARVVDAETDQPIEGAIVVAVWELDPISGEGPRLQVAEVLTDAQGQFFFPGWGPKPRPPLTEFGTKSPYLLIFKRGYVPVRLHNARKSEFTRLRALTNLTAAQISYRAGWQGDPEDAVQESLWDGMAIRIERFRGTPDEWIRQLKGISIFAGWRDVRRMKLFYQALSAEREYFKTHPTDPSYKDIVESFFIQIDNQLKRVGER